MTPIKRQHPLENFTKSVLIIVIAAHYLTVASGKIITGHLQTKEKWHFLDRFCFLSILGSFEYEIEYDSNNGNVSLLLYPDNLWGNAYNISQHQTCQEKVNVLSLSDHQRLVLIPPNPGKVDNLNIGCKRISERRRFKFNEDRNRSNSFSTTENPVKEHETFISTKFVCKGKRIFRSSKPRWWFFALSSCNNTKGMDLKYNFRMMNGDKKDVWHEHFSADEFHILPTLLGFCGANAVLFLITMITAVVLQCRHKLQAPFAITFLSITFQLTGLLSLCYSFGNYALTGIAPPNIRIFGCVFEAVGEFVFIFVLLLLAHGYSINRTRPRTSSAVELTLFSVVYLVVYAFLLVREKLMFDPGRVLYFYESFPGYGALVLKMFGYMNFTYAVVLTLCRNRKHYCFYSMLFCLFSLWFLADTAAILAVNRYLERWNREKISVFVKHLSMLAGHATFLMFMQCSCVKRVLSGSKQSNCVQRNFSRSFGNDEIKNYDTSKFSYNDFIEA